MSRDQNGTALAGCTVKLFETSTDRLFAQTISDAGGNYTFIVPGNGTYYAVEFLAGAPNLAGASFYNLSGGSVPSTAVAFVRTQNVAAASMVVAGAQVLGDLLIASFSDGSGVNTLASITDTAGNTWTKAIGPIFDALTSFYVTVYYAWNCRAAGGGTNTVTANPSSPFVSPVLMVSEYSGVKNTSDPLDAAKSSGSGTNQTTLSTGTSASATTKSGDLIFACFTGDGGSYVAGSGYNGRGIAQVFDFIEDKAAGAPATQTATCSVVAGGSWAGVLLSFLSG